MTNNVSRNFTPTLAKADRWHRFETGAERQNPEGKGRFDLIPFPALRAVALWYEKSTESHPERNWELGMPLHVYLSAAMRHLSKLCWGMEDEDHAAAVIWNVGAFITTLQLIREGNIDERLDTRRNVVLDRELAKLRSRKGNPVDGPADSSRAEEQSEVP